MIFVGIDDTDILGAPGTNQLAKQLARHLSDRFRCHLILRHQLLFDDRVPYTSKNSSATLVLSSHPSARTSQDELFDQIAGFITQYAADGSDPGLCLGSEIPPVVWEFGHHCKSQLSSRDAAYDVAERACLRLAGLGGTRDGVIGAVAAVGLAAAGNDGRVVMIDGRDDLSGTCDIADLTARQVEVRCHVSDQPILQGRIDVGKHLRPNRRGGKIVQFASRSPAEGPEENVWKAVRVP